MSAVARSHERKLMQKKKREVSLAAHTCHRLKALGGRQLTVVGMKAKKAMKSYVVGKVGSCTQGREETHS